MQTASVQESFEAVFAYLAKAHARFLLEHQDIASSAGKVMNCSGGYDETIPSAEDLKFYEDHHPGAAKRILDMTEEIQKEYWASRKKDLARRTKTSTFNLVVFVLFVLTFVVFVFRLATAAPLR